MRNTKGLSNTERILIFAPLILVMIIMSFLFKCGQSSRDELNSYMVPLEFKGIIIEKYRKKTNYNETMITYKDKDFIDEVDGSNWIGLFEYADIGDSIFKKNGDSLLTIKKKNELINKFNYFYGQGWGISKRKW